MTPGASPLRWSEKPEVTGYSVSSTSSLTWIQVSTQQKLSTGMGAVTDIEMSGIPLKPNWKKKNHPQSIEADWMDKV